MKNLPLWIVLGLLVVLAFSGIGQYNRLVTLDQDVKARWSQVENQLQRRNDLIPNLVGTVKGVAGQEQKVFGDIANARARMAGGGSLENRIDAAKQMDSALGRLLVVVENYPQLKSQENFSQLQAQLEGTENRLATERMRFTETVREYNGTIRRFPAMLFANLFGFKDKPYYEAAPGAKDNPKVQF